MKDDYVVRRRQSPEPGEAVCQSIAGPGNAQEREEW